MDRGILGLESLPYRAPAVTDRLGAMAVPRSDSNAYCGLNVLVNRYTFPGLQFRLPLGLMTAGDK